MSSSSIMIDQLLPALVSHSNLSSLIKENVMGESNLMDILQEVSVVTRAVIRINGEKACSYTREGLKTAIVNMIKLEIENNYLSVFVNYETKENVISSIAESIIQQTTDRSSPSLFFPLRKTFHYDEKFGFSDFKHIRAELVIVNGNGKFIYKRSIFFVDSIYLEMDLEIKAISLMFDVFDELKIGKPILNQLIWKNVKSLKFQ